MRALLLGLRSARDHLDLVHHVPFHLIELLLEGLRLLREALLRLLHLLVVHGFQVVGGLELLARQRLLSLLELGLTRSQLLALQIEHLFYFRELLHDRVV